MKDYWRNTKLFNKWGWKKHLNSSYTQTYTKINSNWIKNLNVKRKIFKLLEKNVMYVFLTLGKRRDFNKYKNN